MKQLTIVVLASLCLLLESSGCRNLMHKSVALDNSVTAFKVTTGDAQSNFIPQVILGNGRSILLDMPMQDGAEVCYYGEEAGVFTSSISRRTTIYMKAGQGIVKGHVKVEAEDGKIIDVPLFKIYYPVWDIKDIKVDGVLQK